MQVGNLSVLKNERVHIEEGDPDVMLDISGPVVLRCLGSDRKQKNGSFLAL